MHFTLNHKSEFYSNDGKKYSYENTVEPNEIFKAKLSLEINWNEKMGQEETKELLLRYYDQHEVEKFLVDLGYNQVYSFKKY